MTTRQSAGDLGLLVLRVGIGGLMLVHGWQKLSAFGELADTFADPLGIGSRMSLVSAIAAEVGCSLLLVVGATTRLATLPLAFTMVIALFVVHAEHPWQKKELAAIYLLVYVVIAFTGPGRFSLDELFWSKRKSKAGSANSPGEAA